MQKLYCYVDESEQDNRSNYFVVVTIVLGGSQDAFREELLMIEETAKTNKMKWHKTRHERRIHYLRLVYEHEIAAGRVYFGKYKKPLPYFFPMIDVLERAIKQNAEHKYTATVYVDGIDRTTAWMVSIGLPQRSLPTHYVRAAFRSVWYREDARRANH